MWAARIGLVCSAVLWGCSDDTTTTSSEGSGDNVQKTTASSEGSGDNGEETTTASSAGEETTTASSAVEETTTASSAVEETTTASSAGEETTTASSAGEETTTPEEAGEETTTPVDEERAYCITLAEGLAEATAKSFTDCGKLLHNAGLWGQCLTCEIDAKVVEYCSKNCQSYSYEAGTHHPGQGECDALTTLAGIDYQQGGCSEWTRVQAESCVAKDTDYKYAQRRAEFACEKQRPPLPMCEACMKEEAITSFCDAPCGAMHSAELKQADCGDASELTRQCETFTKLPTEGPPTEDCIEADVRAEDAVLKAERECAVNDHECVRCASIAEVAKVCHLGCTQSLIIADWWASDCEEVLRRENLDYEVGNDGCKNYPEGSPPGAAKPTSECLIWNSQMHQTDVFATTACEKFSAAHVDGSKEKYDKCHDCTIVLEPAYEKYCSNKCYGQFIQGGADREACDQRTEEANKNVNDGGCKDYDVPEAPGTGIVNRLRPGVYGGDSPRFYA